MKIYKHLHRSFESKIDFVPDSKFKKLVKATNKSLQLCKNQTEKISSIIHSNFKDIFHQSEINQIMLYLSTIFQKGLISILNSSTKFQPDNKEKVCNFLILFYDFYEDELVTSTKYIISTVINSKEISDSYILSLCKVLIYSNELKCFSETQREELLNDAIKVLNLIYKIEKFFLASDEETEKFVSKSIDYSKSSFINLICVLFEDIDKKGIIKMINCKNEFSLLYKNLTHFLQIRKCIYKNVIHMKINMFEKEYEQFTKFIEENGCINEIFTTIKDDYLQHKYDSIKTMFDEIKKLFIIQILLSYDNIESEMSSIILILNEIAQEDSSKGNQVLIEQILNDLFKQSMIDVTHVHSKQLKGKSITTLTIDDFISYKGNKIENISIIKNFIELFKDNKHLRSHIIKVFVDNLNDHHELYENIINQTDFIQSIIGNLYQCDKEAISSFSALVLSFLNEGNTYTPIKEIVAIITSLSKCKDSKAIYPFFKILECFYENASDTKNISEVSTAYIDEVLYMIKKASNEEDKMNSLEKKDSKEISPLKEEKDINEVLLSILSFSSTIIRNSPDSFENFKKIRTIMRINSSSYSSNEGNFASMLRYTVLKILIENEKDQEEINNYLSFILKRYNFIYEPKFAKEEDKEIIRKKLIEIMKELNNINDVLKLFFTKGTHLPNVAQENIIKSIFSLGDFLTNVNIKPFFLDNWTYEFQNLLKDNINQLMDILQFHNMNILNKTNRSYLKINYEQFKISIASLLIFLSYLPQKEFLLDMIKYIIDKALSFRYIKGNQNEQLKEQKTLMNKNFISFYLNNYAISPNSVNNGKNSNFLLQSAALILILLDGLVKANKFIVQIIDFIEFLCNINQSNLKMLLRGGLLREIINLLDKIGESILTENNEFDISAIAILNQISSLIITVLPYLQKKEVLFLIDYFILHLNSPNNDKLNDCISNIMKSIPKALDIAFKNEREVIFVNKKVHHPGYYNVLFSPSILLNSSCEEESISIIQKLRFNGPYDSMKFTLMKLKKERNTNPIFLEISIDNLKLMVRDNADYFTLLSNDISIYIQNNQRVNFIYKFMKSSETLDIYINNLNTPFVSVKCCTFIHELFSNNIQDYYSLIMGFIGSNIQELYNDKYENFPYISLDYMMIYDGILSNNILSENVGALRMRSLISNELNFINLNEEENQKISSSSQGNYKIDNLNSIFFELASDKIDIIKVKEKEHIDKSQSSSNDYFERIQIDIGISLNDKLYIEHIPNTNYSSLQKDNKGIEFACFPIENTYLISSYNFIDTFKFNYVLEEKSIKTQIKENIIFGYGENNLMISCYDVNLAKYIILLGNNLEKIQNPLIKKNIFSSLMRILNTFLSRALNELEKLANNKHYINNLFFILYQNINLIDINIISDIFFLSFAYPIPISNNSEIILNTIKFPSFIIDLLLNPLLFEGLSSETKNNIIEQITRHILLRNGNICKMEDKRKILNRLIFILLSCNSNSKEIDMSIIQCITFLFKKGGINSDENSSQSEKDAEFDKVKQLILNLIEVLSNFETSVVQLIKEDESRNLLKGKDIFYKLFCDENLYYNKIVEAFEDVIQKKKKKDEENASEGSTTITGIIQGAEREEEFNQESWIVFQSTKAYNLYIEVISFIDKFLLLISSTIFAFDYFKEFISNVYCEFYIRCINDRTLYKKYHKTQNEQVSFSYNLTKQEGPSRTRKRYQLYPDVILNYEIDHSKKKLISSSSLLLSRFKTLSNKMQSKFNIFCAIENIYKRPFNIVLFSDKNKKQAYNCLLCDGMRRINSIFVFSKTEVVIITNMLINRDGSVISKKKQISNLFWVMKDSEKILLSHLKEENNSIAQMEEEQEKPIKKFEREYHNVRYISFSYREINEIHKRRYLHQDNSLEIFLNNGISYNIAFNIVYRDPVFNTLVKKYQSYSKAYKETFKSTPRNIIFNNILTPSSALFLKNQRLFTKKSHLTKHKKKESAVLEVKQVINDCQAKWNDSIISNYDYIMILNTLGARSYNDLSQYPVIPWVISDYSSPFLDLVNGSSFRNFAFPIYAQSESKRLSLREKFNEIEGEESKYHSGSHYSNPTFIAYYTIRIKPFTIVGAEIQGDRIDTPERLFFHIQKMYNVDDKYQELIPEFVVNPEIFINWNEYDLEGKKEKNEINDVILPKWAMDDPRLFTILLRRAFESSITSEKINDWIDLIFGYHRKGKEAMEYCNVLRKACSIFEPNRLYEERKNEEKESEIFEEFELNINEISDMGQNPIMLFTKPHPKRKEKKNIAIGIYQYLPDFQSLPLSSNEIKLDSKIKEIYSYYESQYKYMSHGEGGLSSFRMCCENEESANINKNESDISGVFFAVGEKRCLLPPSYKNYIDWSFFKHSFRIVKPLKRVAFEFQTHSISPISALQVSRDGKYIIVGFANGNIIKYKIKKLQSEELLHPKKEKKIEKKTIMKKISNFIRISKSAESSKDLTKSQKQKLTVNNSKLDKIFDPSYQGSTSNIKHYDSYLSNEKNFIQVNPIIYLLTSFGDSGYFAHSTSEIEMKNLYKSREKNTFKKIYLFLINSNKSISNEISLINICDWYNLLIVVDIFNFIYLFDFNSLSLLRAINYNKISKSKEKIKHISICEISGDFVAATSHHIVLFNINGVPLSKIEMSSEEKMNCVVLKSIKLTESDVNLFTLHINGSFRVWKVKPIPHEENDNVGLGSQRINSYRFAYNEEYYLKHCDKNFQFPLQFVQIAKYKKEKANLQFFKITEDLNQIILISDKGNSKTISYESFIKKKGKLKSDKKCPNPKCLKDLSISTLSCYFCNKKVCPDCKAVRFFIDMNLYNIIICNECDNFTKVPNKIYMVFY